MLVCAITESRGPTPTVGICFLSPELAQCLLIEFADSTLFGRTVQEVTMLEPTVILVPDTALRPIRSKLVCILAEHFSGVRIEGVRRGDFDENAAIELLRSVSVSPCDAAVSDRFFCLSSLAAAAKYVGVIRAKSLLVEVRSASDTMLIDRRTMGCLELIAPAVSLQDVVGKTSTKTGQRCLRRSVLQPCLRPETIAERQDAIGHLVSAPVVTANLRQGESRSATAWMSMQY